MYYYDGKISRRHIVCPLYVGGLYLGESVMGGSTVSTFKRSENVAIACV